MSRRTEQAPAQSPEQEPEQILSILESHPLSRLLRDSAQDVGFSRAVVPLSNEERRANLTHSTLATADGFAIPPAVLTSNQARTVLAVFHFGPGLAGHRGIVHGGIVATIFDECCARASGCHFDGVRIEGNSIRIGDLDNYVHKGPSGWVNTAGITANLSVSYKRPTMTGSFVIVQATVDQEESSTRKAVCKAQMWDMQDKLLAEATGLFIKPGKSSL